MIKVAAVSYLNTLPFIYGLNTNPLIDSINLQLDYPAICGNKLINREVDLALVPVVVISELETPYIISDYCIGANGSVETVCLYSEVPISEVETISLDYQSRTSIGLLKLLLKDYWKLNPELKSAESGFENNIRGKNAALVIGDRAFSMNKIYPYIYDLSFFWKQMTGLPFVFAVWVSNDDLSSNFRNLFNNALMQGLASIEEALINEDIKSLNCENPKHYLKHKISYDLDAKKLAAMELFLKSI